MKNAHILIFISQASRGTQILNQKKSHLENLGEMENTFQNHESMQRINLTNEHSNDDLSLRRVTKNELHKQSYINLLKK